jgi:hypothetical protein
MASLVSKNHRGACFGECRGRGMTYAAAGSCDEGNLPV